MKRQLFYLRARRVLSVVAVALFAASAYAQPSSITAYVYGGSNGGVEVSTSGSNPATSLTTKSSSIGSASTTANYYLRYNCVNPYRIDGIAISEDFAKKKVYMWRDVTSTTNSYQNAFPQLAPKNSAAAATNGYFKITRTSTSDDYGSYVLSNEGAATYYVCVNAVRICPQYKNTAPRIQFSGDMAFGHTDMSNRQPASGGETTLTVTPNNGYKFVGWFTYANRTAVNSTAESAETSYDYTWDGTSGNGLVMARFELGDLTLEPGGWCTFVNTCLTSTSAGDRVVFPAGVDVYTVKHPTATAAPSFYNTVGYTVTSKFHTPFTINSDVSNTTLELVPYQDAQATKGGVFPNQAVLVHNPSDKEVTVTLTASSTGTAIKGNALLPACTNMYFQDQDSYDYYVLSKKDGVYGFYKLGKGVYIPAGKGYIRVKRSAQSSSKEMLGFDLPDSGETTAVQQVESAEQQADAPVYNLSGQRVDDSYKGVVIQNGKKFVRK